MTTVLEGKTTYPSQLVGSISEWQKYTMEAQAVRKIPEGYVIIEMYTTSRNEVNPNRPGVDINGEGRTRRISVSRYTG